MKRPRKTADDGPGITRLAPEGRTYHFPEDLKEWLEDWERWIHEWNESKAWTFDGFVAQADRLAREKAPGPTPAQGTVPWIAREILKGLRDARALRGRDGDGDLIGAFLAGQGFGHLLTKLGWEIDALRGERDLAHNRRIVVGGRQPMLAAEDVDRLLTVPAGKRGAQIRRWPMMLA